jgi:hypothetical protein
MIRSAIVGIVLYSLAQGAPAPQSPQVQDDAVIKAKTYAAVRLLASGLIRANRCGVMAHYSVDDALKAARVFIVERHKMMSIEKLERALQDEVLAQREEIGDIPCNSEIRQLIIGQFKRIANMLK